MTIIRWHCFTVGCLTQTPVKYVFFESLRIVDYEGILIKIKKLSFLNIAHYFQKYKGSLIKFISGRI